MAFANQFALSLEVTRLVPLGLIANKTAELIMTHARELRHSGSDIVVEEDLASVFGRSRIADGLASSFRTVMKRASSNTSLWEGIMLQAGPGPSMIRALKEAPYFAMMVQLSLLVWTCEATYLAPELAKALAERLQDDSSSSPLHSSPDSEGILKVLRVCENQTSAFNWNMLLHAVATILGCPKSDAVGDIPVAIVRGALDMFPLVQSLPADRLVHIQVPISQDERSATCALVVWTHHVLGLTVLVKVRKQDGTEDTLDFRFGHSGAEQIIIEQVDAENEPTITLLDSLGEHLLTIKLEPDEEVTIIGSTRRIPARGWGNVQILESLNWDVSKTAKQAMVEDLHIVATGFAQVIAQHLVKDESSRVQDPGCSPEELASVRKPIAYPVDQERLLEASRFLFDNARLSKSDVDQYAASYALKALDLNLPKSSAFEAATRAAPSQGDFYWDVLCNCAKELSIFLLTFAHILNMVECENLMFSGSATSTIYEHPLLQQLEEWNGRDNLVVRDDTWLQAIAVPLLSIRTSIWTMPWDRVCLLSDRGWSAWIPTFESADPTCTTEGSVVIGRGSPCRNGVWKQGVRDSHHASWAFQTDPILAEVSGQSVSMRCAERVTIERPYCGEGAEVFLVSAKFRRHKVPKGISPIQRLGYRQLQRSLWMAHRTQRCLHHKLTERVTLPVDCATVEGFGHYLYCVRQRILICLTANNAGARWLALATFPYCSVLGDEEAELIALRQLLLRGHDCCFKCAIDQAAIQPGKWFIIL